jgi:hypothetical protein
MGFAQVFEDEDARLGKAVDESCMVWAQCAVLRGSGLSAGAGAYCRQHADFVVGVHVRQDNDRFKPALVLIHFCFPLFDASRFVAARTGACYAALRPLLLSPPVFFGVSPVSSPHQQLAFNYTSKIHQKSRMP